MSDVSQDVGVVYVLTNEVMPGIVKIGTTERDVDVRIRELSQPPGVPLPFDTVCAYRVKNPAKVERALHEAFAPDRVNPKREFFRIEAERVIAILELLDTGSDVTDVTFEFAAEAEKQLSAEDKKARDDYKRKMSPKMNFKEMGIPIGAKLVYVNDPSIEIEVCGDKKVVFNGEQMSISAATDVIRNNRYGRQVKYYWLYNDKKLVDIYWETYGG